MVKVVGVAAALACVLVAGCTSSTAGESPTSSVPAPVTAPSSSPATSSDVPSATADPIPAPTTSSPPASSPTSSAAPPSSSAPAAATAATVVRPATAAGKPAAGWTVLDQSITVDCQFGTPSAVAVDDGIVDCSPTAAGAFACWRGDASHVVCLADIAGKRLWRFPDGGSFVTAPKPSSPLPVQLVLADDSLCSLRTGGTGTRLDSHPDWVDFYHCGGQRAVFGPPGGSPIDASARAWTVPVGSDDGQHGAPTTGVAQAVFVGTAAG